MRSWLLVAVVGAMVGGSWHVHADEAKLSKAAELVSSKRVLVIAHRGASAKAPENTIPAFEAALATKCDLIELDYYHSADKVPVVFHDKTLDRTTNAIQALGKEKIAIGSLTAAKLQSLDAGAWFKPEFAGAKIPTLVESLDCIQNGGVTLIERKGGDAATIVKLLDEKKLRGEVVVQAFDWKYIADCRRLAPDLVLGCLGSKELGPSEVAAMKAAGANVVGWSHKDLTAANIKRVHNAGMQCWAYTINDAERAKELIAAGLDGIITDDPALQLKVVESLQATKAN
jgi:glycerophosphoryl diester phosphodiesterase